MNNYFCDGLMFWEANIDTQPVFHHYKAVSNMCIYLSKSENECLVEMKQAVRNAFEKELNNYDEMKLVPNADINKGNPVFRSVSIRFYQVSGYVC